MARNKKINAIIAISLALAVVGFHFGTSKSRNDYAEWKNFLMENGPGPEGHLTSQEATKILGYSCNSVTPSIYRQLLASNLDYAYKNDKGDTFWHLCQKSPMWGVLVSKLKEANVSMETSNKEGRTPWLVAVATNNVERARWFKDNGANVAALDNTGNPAWFLAGPVVQDALQLWGLDKSDMRNALGQTDFMYALSNNQNERAKKLFDMGPDLAVRDTQGKVALHYAAASGNEELTLAIVQRNPEYMYMEDNRRKKPVDVAQTRTRSILREYTSTNSRYE